MWHTVYGQMCKGVTNDILFSSPVPGGDVPMVGKLPVISIFYIAKTQNLLGRWWALLL